MNPQAASYRKGAAKTVGYTARVGEELKHRKYAEDTKDNDRRLTAFAMESFGGMGAEARGFLLNVASLVAERTNQDKASTYRGYAERVSIRVVRGAAAAINRRGLVADRRTAGVDPSLTDPGMSGFIGPGCLDEVQRRVEDLHEEQELERAGAQTAKDGSTLSEVEEGGGESETASEVEEFPGDAPGQERGRTRSPSPPPAGVQVRAKGGCGGGGASDGRNEDEHMEGQSLDRAVMPPSGGHGAATHKGGPEESEIRGSQGHLYDALMRRDSGGLPEGAEPKTPGGDVDMEGPSQETEPAATSPNRGSARGPGPSGTTAPAAERTPAPEEPKPTPEEGLGHALDAPMRGCNRDSPVSLEPTAPGPAEDDAGTGWPGRESTSATHRHYIVHAHNEHAERGQRWTMLDGMNTSFSTAPRYEDTDTFLFAYQPTLEQPEALGDTRDAAPLGSASQDIPEAGEADNGNREGGGVGAQGATRPRHPQPEAPTGDPEVYPEHPGRSPSDAMRSPADTVAGPAEATASEGHSPVVTAPKATTQSTPQRTSETEGGHGPANSGTNDEGPSSEEYLARFEEATRRLAAGRAPQEGKLEAEAAGDDEKDSLSSESDEPNSLSTGPRTVTAARGMGVGDGQGGQAFHVTPPDTPRTPEPETAQESAARPGTSGPDGQAGDPGAELFPARGVPDMDAEEGIAFRLAGVRRKRDADSACDEGGEDEPPGPTRGITKKARGPKYAWDVVTPPELEDRFPISLHRKAGQGRVADEWGWAALNWLAVAHGRRRVPFAQLFRIQMWLAWERRRSSDFETPIDEQLALRGRCTAETLTVAARDLLGIILLRGKPPRKHPPGRWSALLGTLQDGEEGQWKYARAHPKGKGILFMDTEAGESRQDPAWHELDAVYTTLYAQVPLPLK
ncbi:hypothetical protein DIPPA_12771 [Diplonema papillatum]|nr:hypothetical protein DIPPA_12771 [Diplonema papillatum]